jgi:hypothetical protein
VSATVTATCLGHARPGPFPPAWSGSGRPGLVSGECSSLRPRYHRRRSLTPSRTPSRAQARRARPGYVRDSDTVPKLQVTSVIGHCRLSEPDSSTPMAQKESACSKKSSCTRVMCWRRRRDSKSFMATSRRNVPRSAGRPSTSGGKACWPAASCTRTGPTSDSAESGQTDRG